MFQISFMDRRTYVWYNRLIRNILFIFRGSRDVDKIYAACLNMKNGEKNPMKYVMDLQGDEFADITF